MPRAFQHMDRALRVHRHIFERLLNRGNKIADAAEMKDVGHVFEDRILRLVRADITLLDRQAAVLVVMRQVGEPAAEQIVDDSHLHIFGEAEIDRMAADEAGAAGNERDAGRRHIGLRTLSALAASSR